MAAGLVCWSWKALQMSGVVSRRGDEDGVGSREDLRKEFQMVCVSVPSFQAIPSFSGVRRVGLGARKFDQ